jgi:hypothetical protein
MRVSKVIKDKFLNKTLIASYMYKVQEVKHNFSLSYHGSLSNLKINKFSIFTVQLSTWQNSYFYFNNKWLRAYSFFNWVLFNIHAVIFVCDHRVCIFFFPQVH